MTILPATIVAFYNLRELTYAWVNSVDGSYCKLVTEHNEAVSLCDSRFIWVGRETWLADDTLKLLSDFRRDVDAFQGEIANCDFSCLKNNELSLEAIAEVLLLNTDVQQAALYTYIKNHPANFTSKKGKFRLKTDQEQQACIADAREKEKRSEYLQAVQDFATGNVIKDEYLHLLYSELPGLEQSKDHKDLFRLICNIYPTLKSDDAVYQMRLRCKELPREIDPAIAFSGIPVGFSPILEQEQLHTEKTEARNIMAFSIDDEDTKDFDDAISLIQDKDLWRLGIHVSNVSAAIKVGESLYIEAEKRVSSIYAANCVIPMFPPRFSENELSLIADTNRQVVSLYVWFNEKLERTREEFCVETISIANNYTYQEIDKRIKEEPFARLMQVCRLLHETRESSHNNEKPRFYYYLKMRQGKLHIKRIDNQSPSRFLVEELMIMYNSSFANYCCEKQVPMIYRNITQFSIAGDQTPASQAYLSTIADFHPGIGAAAYLHASSPIRRFTDLVNQYQMVSALQGNIPSFSQEKLVNTIYGIERKLIILREVTQKSERYWWLKYIEAELLHTPLDATLRGKTQNTLRLELLPWGKQVMAICDSFPVADSFKIVVYDIDWQDWAVKIDLL